MAPRFPAYEVAVPLSSSYTTLYGSNSSQSYIPQPRTVGCVALAVGAVALLGTSFATATQTWAAASSTGNQATVRMTRGLPAMRPPASTSVAAPLPRAPALPLRAAGGFSLPAASSARPSAAAPAALAAGLAGLLAAGGLLAAVHRRRPPPSAHLWFVSQPVGAKEKGAVEEEAEEEKDEKQESPKKEEEEPEEEPRDIRCAKVYIIPDVDDAMCVKLANGQYHSLQPVPEKNDPEADAFMESFDDELPPCFDPDKWELVQEWDFDRRFPDVEIGFRAEHLGSMALLGPQIMSLGEAVGILREEADSLEKMEQQGWNFDGVEEGWVSASTAVATEPDGRVKVYVLPDDDAAAAVKLATGQYHLLRPRMEEEPDCLVDNSAMELDRAWQEVSKELPNVPRPEPTENEEDFHYMEAVEDTLKPPFSKKNYRLLRLSDLQTDYDMVFGSDSYNYGESIDFEGCGSLSDVAERLRAKADELQDMEERGWRLESTQGETLIAHVDVAWEENVDYTKIKKI